MDIYDGQTVVQVICDEPPTSLHQKWLKDRVTFYRKFEPTDTLRDVAPFALPEQNSFRVRVSGDVSNALWKVIFTPPNLAARDIIEQLADKAAAELAMDHTEIDTQARVYA